jgi:hypothetical protein
MQGILRGLQAGKAILGGRDLDVDRLLEQRE